MSRQKSPDADVSCMSKSNNIQIALNDTGKANSYNFHVVHKAMKLWFYFIIGHHICHPTVNSWMSQTQMLRLLINNHVPLVVFLFFFFFLHVYNNRGLLWAYWICHTLNWYSQTNFLTEWQEDNLLLIAFCFSPSDISSTKTHPLKKH